MMTEEESRAWRPEVLGWADDILPFYKSIVPTLPPAPRIVELGVARGRSLIFLVEELAAHERAAVVYGIDHFAEDYLADFKRNIESASVAARRLVAVVQSQTVKAADNFENGSLDLIFIDADHGYEGCKADLEAWAPKLRAGGILAGHDYSDVDFPGVVRAVDEFATAHGLTVEHPTRSVWRMR